MHDSYTLEGVSSMIDNQAIKKKWKREALFCIKRLRDETDELEHAILDGRSEEAIAIEGVDCIYFLFQALSAKAPNIPLSVAFYKKYESNWSNLKKTEDEKGNVVRR